MVDMFEPNSVESQHLEHLHQKFLVIARWSRLAEHGTIEYKSRIFSQKGRKWNLAIVPQRACVYIVERCSPSEMSRAALTVIYNQEHKRWCDKDLITYIELLVEGHLDVGHAAVLHHGCHCVNAHRIRGRQPDFFHVRLQDSLEMKILTAVDLELNGTWIFWIVSSEKSISGQRASNTWLMIKYN